MDIIFSAILGFYFTAIDAFFGRPDSLEAMIVFSLFALILTAITVAVPLTVLLGAVLYHFGPALAEALWHIERGGKAVRSVAPFWAWVVIGFLMYHLGMLFGEVAAPHYKTLVGGIYALTFAGLMLTGIWAAKQGPKTGERFILAFLVVGMISALLSATLFPWGVVPGVGILTMFCGLLGMTIQAIIEARKQKPCHYRC